MKALEEAAAVGAEQARALEEAFAEFCEQTAQLSEAYAALKGRAEQIDMELQQANRELALKVRQLDEAANLQRSILASIPTAVVVTDLDGVINTFNPAAERMWGRPREEAVGRHFGEVMGTHAGLLAAVLAGRPPGEAVRRGLGGEEPRIISSTACRVEDCAGRPIGAVQVDRDVTRLCALEARLRHQERLADLGRMAAGLAHEIRKPLNGIKGFASILQRRAGGEEGPEQRYIANIMGAADRLNDMLGRLLDFARPDELRPVACDLRAEAEQVAEFVRAERPDGPGVVRVEVPEGCRAVRADPARIKQVLLNLVKNGVEALDGEGEVRIEARPEPGGEERRVRVSVADTGRGIPPEEIPRLAEPFHSTREGGTGLGLAIVERILQQHGTRLEVQSRPGHGTCMEFLLPAADKLEER